MTKHILKTNLAIIGAGPVGLFAIFEAGLLGIKCHVIDALPHPGGQCAALYPEKPIYDIPAHPELSGKELIQNLLAQSKRFAPTFHLEEKVEELFYLEETKNWLLTLTSGQQIEATCVAIAAGAGAFGPNKPPLKNIEQFEPEFVHYSIQNPSLYEGKKIIIAGGGDSALDWANLLAPKTAKTYLVHRRDRFRGAPDSVAKMEALIKAGKIEKITPYQLSAIERAKNKAEKQITITLKTLQGDEKKLEAHYLLPFFGLANNLGPIANWGCELSQKHLKVNPSTMMTNLDSIYAIGDIATYKGKLKLILTGFSEAAIMAHHAYHKIFPGKALHFEYSTSMQSLFKEK